MPYQYDAMGAFLRYWFVNAIFLAAAIAVIRATYRRLGGELDLEYTLREALSVVLASLAFTVIYNLPGLVEPTNRYLATALFSPGCIGMMLLYKATHLIEIEGLEAGLIGGVFVGLHVVVWLATASLAGF